MQHFVALACLALFSLGACSGDEVTKVSTSFPASTPAANAEATTSTTAGAPTTVISLVADEALTVPSDVVMLTPDEPERTGGLDAMDPDVSRAVEAIRVATTTDRATCDSLTAALAPYPITMEAFVADDGQVDSVLLQLLSELQLSISQATSACGDGQTDVALNTMTTVSGITTMIQARDAELPR